MRLLSAAEDAVFFATEHDVQGCTAAPMATCKSVVDPAIVRGAGHGGNGAGVTGGAGGAGGSPTTAERLAPRALTVFGDRFFVADKTYDMVVGCPKSGCTTASIGVVHDPDADFSGGLFVDALAVVWGDKSGIGTAPLPSAGQHLHGDVFSDARVRDVTRIEVSIIGGRDQFVYRGSDGVFATSLWRGDTPEQIQQGSVARDFAADAKSIYVATGAAVVRVDRVTRARSTFAELPAGEVARIVADDRGVFVSTAGSGRASIFRVGDGRVDRIVSSTSVGAISLSEKWVYYAGDGAVRRVAR